MQYEQDWVLPLLLPLPLLIPSPARKTFGEMTRDNFTQHARHAGPLQTPESGPRRMGPERQEQPIDV